MWVVAAPGMDYEGGRLAANWVAFLLAPPHRETYWWIVHNFDRFCSQNL